MAQTDPLIGKKLGDYIIEAPIGYGGMARVYKGFDPKLERYSAVKIIDAHLMAADSENEYRERFTREARAIARLNHPNIVGVYQFGQEDNIYYMAMVFLHGDDLRALLKQHSKAGTTMPHSQVVRIIRDIALALDYAHKEGVIHRDVKPSNIMVLRNENRSVLTDFGLALSVPEGTMGNTFGSVHYVAPEQAVSSSKSVPQSDLYSLGIVLYEMLTGRVPFDDQSAMSVALKHLSEPPPPPRDINNRISHHVEDVLMRVLDKEPSRRYQTGYAFVQALEQAFALSDDEETQQLESSHSRPKVGIPAPVNETHPTMSDLSPDKLQYKTTPPDDSLTRKETRQGIPLVVDDLEKTITDPSKPKAVPPPAALPVTKQSGRRIPLFAIIPLLIIAIGGAVLLLVLSSRQPVDGNIDIEDIEKTSAIILATNESAIAASSETAVAIAVLPTEDVEPTDTEDAATPTEDQVQIAVTETAAAILATNEAVSRAVNATQTAESAQPNNTPQPTGTPPPTYTLAPVAENAQVELLYDGRTLILLNRSNVSINISGLEFHQAGADGATFDFAVSEWGNADSQRSLRAGDCFQVWTNAFARLPEPEECNFRQGFANRSVSSWFWLSETPDAVFTVMRESELLAECPAAPAGANAEAEAGEWQRCLVDIRRIR